MNIGQQYFHWWVILVEGDDIGIWRDRVTMPCNLSWIWRRAKRGKLWEVDIYSNLEDRYDSTSTAGIIQGVCVGLEAFCEGDSLRGGFRAVDVCVSIGYLISDILLLSN